MAMSPDEKRTHRKKEGGAAPAYYKQERDIVLACTGQFCTNVEF
jgi:hypothetical protein